MVLFDTLGPFPRLLGWLWYLLVSSIGLVSASTHTALNLARIFLIKMVLLSSLTTLLFSACKFPKPAA